MYRSRKQEEKPFEIRKEKIMSRKKIVNVNDPYRKYKNQEPVVEMFINKIMWDGKKDLAISIFNEALETAGQKLGCSPKEALEKAIHNVRPLVEVKSRRVGGATYQVPIEVTDKRALQLSIRWIVGFARAKSGSTMSERLAGEFILAARNEGAAVKKKEDTHRMADANKAFAHYRF